MASTLSISGTSRSCWICRGFRLTVSTDPFFVRTDIRMMRSAGREGIRIDQRRIDYAEYRGGGPDPQREGENRRQCESRALDE